MPKLIFILDTRGPLDQDEVDAAMEAFLTSYFSQGFHREAFRFVRLDTVLEEGRQGRRYLQQTSSNGVMTLKVVDGTVHYDPNVQSSNGKPAPIPTEEELASILSAYFSLWGVDNLEQHFRDEGLPVSGVSAVSVDGDVLMLDDGDKSVNGPSEGDDNNQAYILAGSIVGAGVIVLLGVFLIVRMRRTKRNADREIIVIESIDENSHPASKSVASKSKVSVSGDEASAPPPPPPPEASSIPTEYQEKLANPYAASSSMVLLAPTTTAADSYDDDDNIVYESDGDIISVTESLHHESKQGPLFAKSNTAIPVESQQMSSIATTGKSSLRQTAPQTGFQYDASRLDQVISSAKQGQQNM